MEKRRNAFLAFSEASLLCTFDNAPKQNRPCLAPAGLTPPSITTYKTTHLKLLQSKLSKFLCLSNVL